MTALLTLLLVLTSGSAAAEEPAADPVNLEELSWMVGSWAGTDDGVEMEEHWIAPKAGLMLGVHRDVFPSGRAFFEFLRIEAGDDGVIYWASPRGRQATPFRLIESAPGRVAFENPEHDWPQRILYWLEDKDTLAARAEGEQGGKSRAAEWRWSRASQTHD
jgi:hypothetical protein